MSQLTEPQESTAQSNRAAPRKTSLAHRLYTGDISLQIVRLRKRWYVLSGALVVIALIALLVRGLSLGIEFSGGADFQAPTQVTSRTVDDMRAAVQAAGLPDMGDTTVTTVGENTVRVQTRSLDSETEVPLIREAIAEQVDIAPDEVAYSLIGASWGKQITQQGLIALGVFLVLVMLLIWVYFRDLKMSIAAIVALLHDLILTIGAYALIGFTFTPATLIGMLTILGYSLYDTVVVFDKVRENTRGLLDQRKITYATAANNAINQVLIRSINTTIIGVLPVAALLVAGWFYLGTGPLKDLGLVLFVGMIAGAFSSVLIATPLLVDMKQREPEIAEHTAAVEAARTPGRKGQGGQKTETAPDDDARPDPEGATRTEDPAVEESATTEPGSDETAESGDLKDEHSGPRITTTQAQLMSPSERQQPRRQTRNERKK